MFSAEKKRRDLGVIDIISNKKLDQKVVEFLHCQDYSLVENFDLSIYFPLEGV